MRDAIPDLAFGTDIIVGFPGETEADFRETLEVVEEVGYDSAFTFVYSPRNGTEAAVMADQVPHEVKIERMERLVELTQRDGARAERRRGSAGSRRCSSRARRAPIPRVLRGRTRRNTTVNFTGERRAGRARRGRGRVRDVDDAARHAAGPRRSLNASITLFRQD